LDHLSITVFFGPESFASFMVFFPSAFSPRLDLRALSGPFRRPGERPLPHAVNPGTGVFIIFEFFFLVTSVFLFGFFLTRLQRRGHGGFFAALLRFSLPPWYFFFGGSLSSAGRVNPSGVRFSSSPPPPALQLKPFSCTIGALRVQVSDRVGIGNFS